MGDVERELEAIRREVKKVLEKLDGRLMKPIALPPREAAAAIGLGETKFGELLKRKLIPSFLVEGGRKRLVRVEDLEEWAARQVVPLRVRFPRTKKGEGDKVREALRRERKKR